MTSTMNKLRQFKEVPTNGLAIFSGMVVQHGSSLGSSAGSSSSLDDGVETGAGKAKWKRLCIALEPLLPLKHGMYYCDDRFHCEALMEQLKEVTARTINGATKGAVGFVIMNADGFLLGSLNGTSKAVLAKLSVRLPKKHHKGGQSAARFERLRKEARAYYVKLAAENINRVFISADKPTISSIIYAGCAHMKNVLSDCPLIDYRLKKLPSTIVDIAYGGEAGFNEAIEASGSVLQDIKYVQEKQMLSEFMEEIAKDSNKVVYGFDQTIQAIEVGAVQKVIAWEDLQVLRVSIKTSEEEDAEIKYMSPKQFQEILQAESKDSSIVYEPQLVLEYLVENHKKFGVEMEIIGNATPEAKQFICGFGGIGGILRYEIALDVDSSVFIAPEEDDDLSEFI